MTRSPRQPDRRREKSVVQAANKKSTAREFMPIRDVLDRLLKQNNAKQRTDPASLFGKWKEIVGETIAARTRVIDVRRGELVVEVNASPLLNELSTFHYKDILSSLSSCEEFRGVRSIRFRAGAF